MNCYSMKLMLFWIGIFKLRQWICLYRLHLALQYDVAPSFVIYSTVSNIYGDLKTSVCDRIRVYYDLDDANVGDYPRLCSLSEKSFHLEMLELYGEQRMREFDKVGYRFTQFMKPGY